MTIDDTSAVPDNPISVVIADDDRDLLQLVRMKLERDGFRVAISVNAEDINRIAVEKHADIILLDISMEGISGEDICKQLKNHRLTSTIPVLLFSGNEDIEEMATSCGADDFIPKPFRFDAIREKILTMLPESRLR